MFLSAPDGRRIALCYSMNVHPGEGLDDVLAALEEFVVPLKRRLSVEGPFAVGLRLANRAAEETATRALELKQALRRHALEAVTVNAFPFGDFHGERVKEQVYRPDWSEASRAIYTLRAAVAIAAVNQRGSQVSLSTLPLSAKAFRPSINAVTNRFVDLVGALQGVEQKSGVRVAVGLEPEPLCLLETAAETVAWWRQQLMPACRVTFGRGAEELARKHLGVCLDSCHHAVRWEDCAQVIELYRTNEIPIVKIQLSSALEAPSTEELGPFDEPRYCHQVVARTGEARRDIEGPVLKGPVRCHFHVPIHRTEVGGLKTTQGEMIRALDPSASDCFEIETYTWDVLPLKEGCLLDSLEAEFRCVEGLLVKDHGCARRG